jgi:hypothetical protein
VEKDVALSIHLSEDDSSTIATAVLDLRDERFETVGRARRNPTDAPTPIVGEELAIARALAALQHELVEAAWDKIVV